MISMYILNAYSTICPLTWPLARVLKNSGSSSQVFFAHDLFWPMTASSSGNWETLTDMLTELDEMFRLMRGVEGG